MPILPGSTVAIRFVGTLDNGRIFQSTPDDQPLRFTVGAGEIFPALEREIVTMAVGEVRNIVLAAAAAYGPRLAENILALDRSRFPDDREICLGQKLAVEFGGSEQRVMVVTAVSATTITLDGNHPLAGHDLTFALHLVAVE